MLPDPQPGRVFRVVRANITNERETEQNYLSFFLQDTWQLGRRLTIKPGLRYEQQKLIGNLEEFTWDGHWAPRIGAVYDPIGDGRMKVFANWGRYFAKIPNDLAAGSVRASCRYGSYERLFHDTGLDSFVLPLSIPELARATCIMARILVLYGTTDGHTAKVAATVADALRRSGRRST